MCSDPLIIQYISNFPLEIQSRLNSLHSLIKITCPDATACIAYGLPAYKYKNKPLMYFGGFTSHIGVYALPGSHTAFAHKLNAYKKGKGSVQFPNDMPLPTDVIKEMIFFRMKEIDGLSGK